MRLRQLAACAAAAALALPASAADGTPPAPQRAYVSLGDSLAAGMQPDDRGVDRVTYEGYPNVVAHRLGMRLRRLSCGGATTHTLLAGGARCERGAGPGQLERAEAFLAAHPETALVTVDIGDNDVEGCFGTEPPAIDVGCVHRGRVRIARNLPEIARRLRAAAGPQTKVVGILDYNQFLALWLDGAAGRAAARRSVRVIGSLNALMGRIYRDAGMQVADAGTPFDTTDLHTLRPLPGHGRVPIAVERVCRWTWACSPPPIGHDDHANAHGYRVIAEAVLAAVADSS